MLLGREHELNGLPPSITVGSQTWNARSVKWRTGGLETVVAAQSAIHEGETRETILSGFEKQRVVVASQAPIEGGEALRGELIVGVCAWVDIALWDNVSRSKSPQSHLIASSTYNYFGKTKTQIFQLSTCALVWSDEIVVEVAAVGGAISFHRTCPRHCASSCFDVVLQTSRGSRDLRFKVWSELPNLAATIQPRKSLFVHAGLQSRSTGRSNRRGWCLRTVSRDEEIVGRPCSRSA
jgi:hypothetical protein